MTDAHHDLTDLLAKIRDVERLLDTVSIAEIRLNKAKDAYRNAEKLWREADEDLQTLQQSLTKRYLLNKSSSVGDWEPDFSEDEILDVSDFLNQESSERPDLSDAQGA